jgi:uncharacterized protein
MPTATAKHAQGTFCWPELGTTDQDGAKRFYTSLFGWASSDTPMGPDRPPYVIFTHKGQACGALYTLMPEQTQNGVPPHWGAYVAVDDCDAAIDKVKANGGQLIMGPHDVMGTFGRMALCSDPQGAPFSLWQAKDHIGIGIMGEPGALCWTELMAQDTAKASAFYGAVIGWKTQAMPMGDGEYICWQRPDGEMVGGLMAITPEMGPMRPCWVSYFQVADIAATVKKAADLGAQISVPATKIPNGMQFAVLVDPQGAHFAVLQAAPQA